MATPKVKADVRGYLDPNEMGSANNVLYLNEAAKPEPQEQEARDMHADLSDLYDGFGEELAMAMQESYVDQNPTKVYMDRQNRMRKVGSNAVVFPNGSLQTVDTARQWAF